MKGINCFEKEAPHMPKAVGIGLQDFKKIRDLDTFYIDKTKFIPEWWNSKGTIGRCAEEK